MINVKYGDTLVCPMPSSEGMFNDITAPNCPATDCCLIRAAQCLRSNGVAVHVPVLTEAEISAAVAAQLAVKADWAFKPEVTDEEVHARRDAIRGYTDAELEAHIEASKVFEKDTEVVESVLTEAEAIAELIKKDMVMMQAVAVTVPSDEDIRALILSEKELAVAQSNVNTLIASGHLVTDLSDEKYTDWKAQFQILEIS